MSNDVVIRADNLGKRYAIGHEADRERYVALRDVVARTLRCLARSTLDVVRGNPIIQGDTIEEFWALRYVGFEITRGEVVGIIGRNGAGKTTLLKILSRITEPSEGRVAIRGRVASLLEVGTGFHPELTGRENIFLNGAILGMQRTEIKRKFDEIVGFAEVDRFLDTPVKHYSSGMYVRLAFAVAAHLEPEILMVDEVLAVGDAEFQKKCLGKMSEVAGSGRTVLFVSHNMAAVEHLCVKSIMLQNGRLTCAGATSDVVQHYMRQTAPPPPDAGSRRQRPSWAEPWIQRVSVLDSEGIERNVFALGEALTVEMSLDQPGVAPIRRPVMGIVIHHAMRGVVSGVNTRMTGFASERSEYGGGLFRCTLPRLPLLQGQYLVDVWLGDGQADIDTIPAACTFTVVDGDVYKAGRTPFHSMGVLFLEPTWEFKGTSALASHK